MSKQKDDVWKAKFHVQLDNENQGTFVIEVHPEWAPLGAERFLKLIQDQYYHQCKIYRVIPGFIIQWGIPQNPEMYAKWGDNKIKDDKRVPSTPSNTRGYVSFATSGKNARGSQIFINLSDDNSQLDGQGFIPFGFVVEGLETCVEKVSTAYSSKGSKKPDQSLAKQKGNAYFDKEFPLLSFIIKTEFV